MLCLPPFLARSLPQRDGKGIVAPVLSPHRKAEPASADPALPIASGLKPSLDEPSRTLCRLSFSKFGMTHDVMREVDEILLSLHNYCSAPSGFFCRNSSTTFCTTSAGRAYMKL